MCFLLPIVLGVSLTESAFELNPQHCGFAQTHLRPALSRFVSRPRVATRILGKNEGSARRLVPAGTNLCVSMNAPLETRPLLVVGSVNADVVIKVPRLPKAGETLKAGGGDVIPGGKGANQAVAAAKMGASVRFAGVFGGDSHGKMLRETMQQAGVCTELSTTSAGPSGQAIILLEPSGANTIVLVPGANADWSLELPTGLLDAIAASREIPERINILVAQHAKKCGVDVLMDVGGDDGPLPTELTTCITLCAPNETELQNLTEMPTSTKDEIVAAANKLLQRGVKKVLVTLGAEGSMVLTETGEIITQEALPLYDGRGVVDTTGAGDCFRSAFAVALSRQLSIQEGLLLGAAAASLCVQTEGAMSSMPYEPSVQAVIERLTKSLSGK